jgi:hypothetical protein
VEKLRRTDAPAVTVRSRRETVTFNQPAQIEGIARVLPAGVYDVVTDEEMIEGLSFACYRRIATIIMVPGEPPHQKSMEMLTVSSDALASAVRADGGVPRE